DRPLYALAGSDQGPHSRRSRTDCPEQHGGFVNMIEQYHGIAPKGDLLLLKRLGEKLARKKFLHINSTRAGGGVAEILQRMIPMLQGIGIDARWEVIEGDEKFFDTTKKMHNALQ